MFRNRLYYSLKPLLPWSLRMGVRRWFAARQRKRVADIWPAKPGSERPLAGWSGWPEGKQFSLVLTHDIESQAGLANVRPLAELEMEMGFRSSFNFVPSGGYPIPRELRIWLTDHGFEVGIHDLHHDGRLFSSRAAFENHAAQINHYLKDWGAVGFRSAFMLRNLEWLHELNVSYDASTFDTDPFEPQPDGVGTIFPLWVPVPDAALHVRRSALYAPRLGYVELPYTLPQDSTLFLLLREKTPEIWFKKLDWIACNGGMALVNVHPDYARFNGAPSSSRTYPVEHYAQLLRYVQSRYTGRYWQALPREVARFVREPSQERVAGPAYSGTMQRNRNHKPKLWIDLDNTPHVPFFEPIIDELRSRGFPLVVTARDAFQVCELAEKKKLEHIKVGRHSGRNRLRKAAGLAFRALQLAPVILREKPVLGVSHGSRSQLLLSNWLRTPTILIEDYEYCQFPIMMRPSWVMAPSVIPDAMLCSSSKILKYPGIKEDVYAWKLRPDWEVMNGLGLVRSDLVVTVRPPATEAHYHNPESEKLLETLMERACRIPQVRIVLLPRNKRQLEFLRGRWPGWFTKGKTIVPPTALDGLNLIWHSDFIVSGGGTMNREAAALGVPVYSIFRGTIGAVDRDLTAQERLILVESVEDVWHKIKFEKRSRKSLAEVTSKHTLHHIVDSIQEVAESLVR